jgi:hypothetical protein
MAMASADGPPLLPCMQIFNLINSIIEAMAENIKPVAGQITSLLPRVWQEADGQSLLRIQVRCRAAPPTPTPTPAPAHHQLYWQSSWHAQRHQTCPLLAPCASPRPMNLLPWI